MTLDLSQEDLGNMTGVAAQIQRLQYEPKAYPYYMEHECGECFGKMSDHPARCFDDSHEEEYIEHFPPLCCPGCGCKSYEEAHE